VDSCTSSVFPAGEPRTEGEVQLELVENTLLQKLASFNSESQASSRRGGNVSAKVSKGSGDCQVVTSSSGASVEWRQPVEPVGCNDVQLEVSGNFFGALVVDAVSPVSCRSLGARGQRGSVVGDAATAATSQNDPEAMADNCATGSVEGDERTGRGAGRARTRLMRSCSGVSAISQMSRAFSRILLSRNSSGSLAWSAMSCRESAIQSAISLRLSSPDTLRAIKARVPLRRLGRLLRTTKGGEPEAAYEQSFRVDKIDEFWSHSWHAKAWMKVTVLMARYNGAQAIAAGTLAAAVGTLLTSLDVLPYMSVQTNSLTGETQYVACWALLF